MRKALMIPLTLSLLTPGCGLFVRARPVVTSSGAGCSSLIDPNWKKPVEAPEPEGDPNTIGFWIKLADATAGKLDVANDRTLAVIGIQERCEARDEAARRRATK